MSGPPSVHSGSSAGPQLPSGILSQPTSVMTSNSMAPIAIQQPELTFEQLALQGAMLSRLLRESVSKTIDLISNPQEKDGDDGEEISASARAHEIKDQLKEMKLNFDNLDRISTSGAYLAKKWPPAMPENLQNLLLNESQDIHSPEFTTDLFDSYSWSDKVMKESAYYAMEFLRPMVKKNHSRFHRKPAQLLNTLGIQELQVHIKQLQVQYQLNFLKISVVESAGSRIALLVDVLQRCQTEPANTLGPMATVMKSALILRGSIPDWMNVKGPDEEFRKNSDGKVDIAEKSKYEVFRKISDYLKGQIMTTYGALPSSQPNALRAFFMSLQRYRILFMEPCRTCRKFLKNNMPAYSFDLRTTGAQAPLHDSCRST